jgi:3-methyladenine DNA glycosylase AlkD
MKTIIDNLRSELKQNADEKSRLSGQRFFKEEILLYGIKSAIVSAIGKKYYTEIKHKTKADVFGLCEDLWISGYWEESLIACTWSYNKRKEFVREDIRIFEKWVDGYVSNWASCDTLCNHTIGALVEQYPELLKDLKRWATSPNRWMKRAAAVSLIIPAREGKFLKDLFEIADILLPDPDDMVQKGYGWMLKVASRKHQEEVFDFVFRNKKTMPRTALRYAIEKMPAGLRLKAMEK